MRLAVSVVLHSLEECRVRMFVWSCFTRGDCRGRIFVWSHHLMILSLTSRSAISSSGTCTNSGSDDTSLVDGRNTLLDSNENDLMSTFFDDPNNFTGFEFGMENNKDNPFNFQFETLGDSNQNPFNLNYLPTSSQMSAFGIPNNQQSHSQPSRGGDGANDDASAASYLMNMSSQHSDTNVPNGPSWNTAGSQDRGHAGFMIPSDDNSSTADDRYGGQLRQVPYPTPLSARHAMANGAYGTSSSRASNPNLDATAYRSFYNEDNHTSQVRTVNGGQRRPPMPFTFGSDQNFSSQGYQGMGSSLQRDKVYNLLPMIEQVARQAAGRDSSMQGVTFSGQTAENGPMNANLVTSPSALQSSNLEKWVDEKRYKSGYARVVDGGDGGEEPQSARRKRRLSQDDGFGLHRPSRAIQDDDYGEEVTPAKRHRKSVAGRQTSSTPASPASSAGDEGGSKKKSRDNKTRPNLSESQKRENHIISEQKRRNVIKQAFNDLNRMVPTLQKGKSGLSKAEVLKEVVNFVQATVQGNKIMSELLQDRNTSNGAL